MGSGADRDCGSASRVGNRAGGCDRTGGCNGTGGSVRVGGSEGADYDLSTAVERSDCHGVVDRTLHILEAGIAITPAEEDCVLDFYLKLCFRAVDIDYHDILSVRFEGGL